MQLINKLKNNIIKLQQTKLINIDSMMIVVLICSFLHKATQCNFQKIILKIKFPLDSIHIFTPNEFYPS